VQSRIGRRGPPVMVSRDSSKINSALRIVKTVSQHTTWDAKEELAALAKSRSTGRTQRDVKEGLSVLEV